MKTICMPSSWLDDISGMTVADAIAYLSKLPQDHELNHWLEGDTHGCSIRCELLRKRPYTPEELVEFQVQRKAKEVERLERQAQYAANQAFALRFRGQLAAAEMHDKRAEETRQRLKQLKET